MNPRIKKIIPYLFITLLALVGFLGVATQVNAQAVPTNQNYLKCVKNNWGTQVECATRDPDPTPTPTGTPTNQNYLDCVSPKSGKPLGTPAECATTNPDTAASLAVAPKTDFENYVGSHGCGLTGNNSLLPGCLISFFYYLFYVIPAFILWLGAYFFNVLISITLNSGILKSSFVSQAWGIVRDLSNIFFILVLLYIAIRLILGIGGSDGKKMIVRVIIMALLINFSMFFTEVVIDSSNILALVFYNKTSVSTKDANGQERPYDSVTGEKDVAGGMVNAFDPTRLLTADFFKTAGTVNTGVIGAAPIQEEVSFGMLIGITILAGVIMLFAAYCLFIAGISFLGRMIEFFVLIVFSPFAFMSSTIPLLEKIEYIGWDAWLKRLLTVSFMAPIFMFFIYFIFLLISVKPPLFDSLVTQTGQGTMVRILSIVIPAMIILILLMKATSFAKKASGTLGEVLIKGTEIAMGAVAGIGLGVAAKGLQLSAGSLGKKAFESSRLTDMQVNGNWAQRKFAGGLRRIGGGVDGKGGMAGSSFDARQGIVGAGLAAIGGVSGLNLGHSSKLFKEAGGRMADLEKQDKKRKAIADGLKTKEGEKEKQNLNKLEEDLEGLKQVGSHAIEQIDNQIKGAQAAVAAAESTLRGETAGSGTAAIGTPGAVGYIPASANYTPASAGYGTAQSEVKKYAALVNDLRKEKSTIKNADSTKITALLAAATTADALAATPPVGATAADIVRLNNAAKAARAAADVANASIKYGGVSMNNLEDTIIPDAKNLVNNLSKQRARDFATNIQNQWAFPWNRAARAKSAHEIRMGAKIETTK